ncbi:MAG: B12-binding domain-containing radical SAM protein [Planctomycetota bacterium]|jgi:radical SAM superfamily enzyme YgiQ (UPF0313 family)
MNVVLVYRGRYHVREALDLETLAAVMRAAGHRVRLAYDPDTFGVTDNVFQARPLAKLLSSDKRTVARIVEPPPDAVIFSVLSSTYGWCRQVAAEVKRRTKAPVVFLGLHPSLVPEHVMRDSSVDYTVAGEAETVVNPLLARIAAGDGVADVGNLWHRSNGRAVPTHRAELVDLDALPLPDKGLFAPFVSHHYSYCAMVSRGCPYNCTFCEETCSKKLHGGKYFRRKSVDTVMRELAAGKRKYRFREVIFKDSYLSGNKRWLRKLMERYRKEIRVPFKCFCTVSGFDEETARLLKEGGCYSIEFGLQTWNDGLRRRVLNRRETSEEAFRAFAHCDRQRLRYDVDHMFNLPAETEADHVLGVECYRRLRYLGRVKVHFLVYFPTADIVEHAVAAGDLPAEAADRLAEGDESDFYDQSRAHQEQRKLVAGYAALYKILPMLPDGLLRWLLKGKRVRHLRRIPSVAMAALQGLNAMRCGDLRFAAYAHVYPAKVLRTVWERIGPLRRSRRNAP